MDQVQSPCSVEDESETLLRGNQDFSHASSGHTSEATRLDEKEPIFAFAAKISVCSLQNSFCSIFELFLNMINIYFIGLYGDERLEGAIGLATIFIMICYESATTTIAGGSEALLAQAFGARAFRLYSNYFYLSFVVFLFFLIIMAILVSCSELILVAIGINPSIAQMTREFLIYFTPSILFNGVYDILRAYLISQFIFNIQFYVTFAGTGLHYVLCAWFHSNGWFGHFFPCVSQGIIDFLYALIFAVLIFGGWLGDKKSLMPIKKTLVKWKKIKSYVRDILPFGIAIFLELSIFEVLTFYVDELENDAELAAHVLIIPVYICLYQFAFGLSRATTTFLGNAAAHHSLPLVRRIIKVVVVFNFIQIAIVFLPLVWFWSHWSHYLTENQAVAIHIHRIWLLLIILPLIDFNKSLFGGILRGVRREVASSLSTAFFQYLLGMPIIYACTVFLRGQGYLSVWIGYGIAVTGCLICNLILYFKTDKEAQIERVGERFGPGNALNLSIINLVNGS